MKTNTRRLWRRPLRTARGKYRLIEHHGETADGRLNAAASSESGGGPTEASSAGHKRDDDACQRIDWQENFANGLRLRGTIRRLPAAPGTEARAEKTCGAFHGNFPPSDIAGELISRNELLLGGTMLRHGGRHNQARRQNAEEALAARIAAIGRHAQKSFHGYERSLLDAIARYMFQIEISATGAMSVAQKGPRHALGIETFVASMAPPRKQPESADQPIRHTTAARAETVRTAALWTNHAVSFPLTPFCAKEYRNRGEGSRKSSACSE